MVPPSTARTPASFRTRVERVGPPAATANVACDPSRVRPAPPPRRERPARTRRSVLAGSFSRSRSRAGAVRGPKREAIAPPTGGRRATVAPTANRPTVRRARSPTGRGASTRAYARTHAMPGRLRLPQTRMAGAGRASDAPRRARWAPPTAGLGSGPRRRSPLADSRTRSGGVTRELALPVGAGERDHRIGDEACATPSGSRSSRTGTRLGPSTTQGQSCVSRNMRRRRGERRGFDGRRWHAPLAHCAEAYARSFSLRSALDCCAFNRSASSSGSS